MFHSRKVNSKANYLQERFLKILGNDYITSFEYLLKKDNFFKTYCKNILPLARTLEPLELFKVNKGIANPILHGIFLLRYIKVSN